MIVQRNKSIGRLYVVVSKLSDAIYNLAQLPGQPYRLLSDPIIVIKVTRNIIVILNVRDSTCNSHKE